MSDEQKPGPEPKPAPTGPGSLVARQRVVCPTCGADITPSVRAVVDPYHTNHAKALILPVNCPECNAVIVRLKLGGRVHLPGN